MKAIVYRAELLEPVLATALEGDPNSAITYDYLPGSVIRGVVSSAYIRTNGIFDAATDLIRQLLFDGSTRYLNAYPVIADRRGLPIPVIWQREKDDPLNILKDVTKTTIDNKTSSVKGYFVRLNDGNLRLYQPQKLLTVHIQRARTGKAEDVRSRAVYQYEALAAGQIFEGVVLCANANTAQYLKTLLDNQEMRIGGSRTGGYGCVRFKVTDICDTWREAPEELDVTRDVVQITLLSDTIVRNEIGEHDAGLQSLVRAIAKRLEFSSPNLLAQSNNGTGYQYIRFAAITRTFIGGFNRKWGLPLPQTPAISKGSTLAFQSVEFNTADLRTLEDEGLGERRTEGFGRVAINLSLPPGHVIGNAETNTTRNINISLEARHDLLNRTGGHNR
jgi:CRISPR-associated protein Csx10